MKKILIIIICVMLCCGCTSKESKTAIAIDEFYTIATNDNFEVLNNMSEYLTYDYISEAYKINLDAASTIEMLVYNEIDTAIKVQDDIIENFGYTKSSSAFSKKEKGVNYYKYYMISNSKYNVTVRVDNTVFFCQTDIGNRERIDKLLADMGY